MSKKMCFCNWPVFQTTLNRHTPLHYVGKGEYLMKLAIYESGVKRVQELCASIGALNPGFSPGVAVPGTEHEFGNPIPGFVTGIGDAGLRDHEKLIQLVNVLVRNSLILPTLIEFQGARTDLEFKILFDERRVSMVAYFFDPLKPLCDHLVAICREEHAPWPGSA